MAAADVRAVGHPVDGSSSNPALPTGHPFTIGNTFYWSATTAPRVTSYGTGVNVANGDFFNAAKSPNVSRAWCVRGGQVLRTPRTPQ